MTWRPAPRDDDAAPRRLRPSLDRYAKRLGVPEASSLGAVFARWDEVVGPAVASHAQPVSLVRGALVVAVDDPAWATQLRYLGADILRRLEEVTGPGVAARLEVRVRPVKQGF
jgi:predicted nucleic acid-binding Zn ribbon protein